VCVPNEHTTGRQGRQAGEAGRWVALAHGELCRASPASLVRTVTVTAGVQIWALQRAPALAAQQQQQQQQLLHFNSSPHPPTRLFLPLSLLFSPVVI
jgi:hypothetical protein